MGKLFRKSKDSSKSEIPRRRAESGSTQSSADTPRTTFRRNRTLTGSSSSQIASSNELNAEFRSPRAHVHHLTLTRRRVFAYFSVVVAASAALYILLTQLVATTSVQVVDGSPLSEPGMKPYQQSADVYYAARPAERLRFMLNTQEFTSHMQASHPEIRSLYLESGSVLGESLLYITMREPIARWNVGYSREFVDSEGIVFAKNYYSEPAVTIRDNSGVRTEDNEVVTSKRFLAFVGRVIGYAKDDGFTVKTATIPALTTRQVRITLKGVEPYFTFSVDRPPAEQVEDMGRIVRYLRTHGISAQYVDIRVQGKAFYR